VTKVKRKYLWSWAIAGVTIALLLLLAHFIWPTEKNFFQEPSPAQRRFTVVTVVLWPAAIVGALLGMMATDSGADSSIVSTVIIAISILLNAAVYWGIGLILWNGGFSRLFQRRSPN
jgi:small-conductance mechanosensitive channel